MVYDTSGLIFTGSNFGAPTQTVHATGTLSWNEAAAAGSWHVTVPFPTFNALIAVDVGAWLNGSIPSTTTSFSSTGFSLTSSANSQNVQGDVQISFTPPLSSGKHAVTGTFSIQNDFAPYDITGSISGQLVPLAAVPEPATASSMFVGLAICSLVAALKIRRSRR